MMGDRDKALFDRREIIAAAAGAAGIAALGAPSTAIAATRRLDPANADDARQIVRKLRYRTDEGLLFWWIKGDYYAQVDATLTPLYGMSFGAIHMLRQAPGGGFDMTQMELGFRTELDTGKRMKTFTNPLTGESMPAPFNPIGPTLVHYSRDAVPTVPKNLGGSELDFQPLPERPFVAQGEVFVQYRARSRVTTPGMVDRIVNDFSMIYGPATKALDPAVTSVDARLYASDVASYPRWMNMGARAGAVTLRGIGAKVMRISDMPQDFLEMLEAHDPSIIKDPEAALRRPPATYKG
jgi:hypothetical protein